MVTFMQQEIAPKKELTSYKLPKDIECGLNELTIKKEKWLFISIYRLPSQL